MSLFGEFVKRSVHCNELHILTCLSHQDLTAWPVIVAWHVPQSSVVLLNTTCYLVALSNHVVTDMTRISPMATERHIHTVYSFNFHYFHFINMAL